MKFGSSNPKTGIGLFATVAAIVVTISGAAKPVRAELLIGLTSQNSLISFDSTTPGTISAPVSITGILGGDTLVGIDRRPSTGANNGFLYAFGVNTGTGAGRIYTLNTTTGLATPGFLLTADPADTTAPTPFTTVTGTSFGVDFNPVPDRLRVTSNTGQNLRINVDNGLTQLDVPLAYQAGDPNFGAVPVDTAVAYSNNFGGATTTTLRGVDAGMSPDLLVIHTNPNGGLLQTSLGMSFDSNPSLLAYDISGLTGTPYFSATPVGAGSSSLYTISGGSSTLIGTIGGGVALRGLAAPVGVAVTAAPEPGTLALAGLGILGLLVMRRTRE